MKPMAKLFENGPDVMFYMSVIKRTLLYLLLRSRMQGFFLHDPYMV
jgi:hypothetical protein